VEAVTNISKQTASREAMRVTMHYSQKPSKDIRKGPGSIGEVTGDLKSHKQKVLTGMHDVIGNDQVTICKL